MSETTNKLGHRIRTRGARTRRALLDALRRLLNSKHLGEIRPADVAAAAHSADPCSAVAGIGVQRGNDQTSCEFAENVARAYADLDQPVTETVTLEDVASPVTGQTYTLTCDFTTPVRCTGGNNAVIYLSPPS